MQKMVNGGTVNYWAIVNFSRQRPEAVDRFVKGLVSMCQNKGIVGICVLPSVTMLMETGYFSNML